MKFCKGAVMTKNNQISAETQEWSLSVTPQHHTLLNMISE